MPNIMREFSEATNADVSRLKVLEAYLLKTLDFNLVLSQGLLSRIRFYLD